MTDNCDDKRSALQFVWPSAKQLLCTFHILQQVWRWLHDKNHQIQQSSIPSILNIFKHAVHAESEEVFESCYEELVNDTCENYGNAAEYFEKLYEDHINFAHCFRSGLTLRGDQTSNSLF